MPYNPGSLRNSKLCLPRKDLKSSISTFTMSNTVPVHPLNWHVKWFDAHLPHCHQNNFVRLRPAVHMQDVVVVGVCQILEQALVIEIEPMWHPKLGGGHSMDHQAAMHGYIVHQFKYVCLIEYVFAGAVIGHNVKCCPNALIGGTVQIKLQRTKLAVKIYAGVVKPLLLHPFPGTATKTPTHFLRAKITY